MSFPSYFDSNSKFVGLLYDYFNIGNLTAKLKTNKTVDLEIGVEHCCKSTNLNLDAEFKVKLDKYNIELVKKYSSNNVLTLECRIEDLFLSNSGHCFSMTNDFSVGHRQALMTNFKKGDKYHAGVDLKFISDRPIIITHGLLGYENYFIGGKLNVDTHKKHTNVPERSLCIGYSVPDFTFQGLILQNKRTTYEASLYSRINDSLQVGAQCEWHRQTHNDHPHSDVSLTLCANISLDKKNNTFVKVKTTNCHTFAVAYGFDFMKGIQLALSGQCAPNDVQFGISAALDMD